MPPPSTGTCASYDGGTENCNECWSYHVLQVWAGMFNTALGQTDNIHNCYRGCVSCDDVATIMFRANTRGNRWLRPMQDQPNRLASGRIGDLMNVEPGGLGGRRVPDSGAWYERSPCYKNDGCEQFNSDACDCHPFPRNLTTLDGNAGCVENGVFIPPGGPFQSLLQDQFFYTDAIWTDARIFCRRVNEHGLEPVKVGGSGVLTNTHVMETEHCTTNPLVWCLASKPDNTCRAAAVPLGTRYSGASERSALAEFGFDASTCAFANTPGNGRSPAQADAMTKVLQAAAGATMPGGGPLGTTFDRVDSEAVDDGSGGSINRWSRTWIGVNHSIPCADHPVVPNVFGNCFLWRSGCPVTVELVIAYVQMIIEVIPQMVTVKGLGWVDAEMNHRMLPMARARFRVDCGLRATLDNPESCQFVRNWVPTTDPAYGQVDVLRIINHDSPDFFPFGGLCERPPQIVFGGQNGTATLEDQRDRLVLVDPAGRPINAPDRVVWHGMLGPNSTPKTADVWQAANVGVPGNVDGSGGICCAVMKALNGLSIPAWPYAFESNPTDPAQVCTGAVVLDTSVNATGLCGAF